MGMFDDISVKYPLPDPEYQDHVFQTKDLENCLNHYIITEGGDLVVERVSVEETPITEEQRAQAEAEYGIDTLSYWLMTRPSVTVTDRDYEQVLYHGDIVFYDYLDDEDHTWIEYRARFTNGKLEWIVPHGRDHRLTLQQRRDRGSY